MNCSVGNHRAVRSCGCPPMPMQQVYDRAGEAPVISWGGGTTYQQSFSYLSHSASGVQTKVMFPHLGSWRV